MQAPSILFDGNIPFSGDKLALLEETVMQMFSSQPAQMMNANQTLEQLKDLPEFWLMTDSILYGSQNLQTKLYCLMAIKSGVQSKWSILPENQRVGIKNFIVDYVYKTVQANSNKDQRICLGKANSILVEIIKNEWDSGWTTAISDLIKSSFQSQEICENNFLILKELSQEVFDFSKHQMTSSKIALLKARFAKEFESIYQVCDYVLKGYLENSDKVKLSLLRSCLETLRAFLGWMPLVYVFLTDLIENILVKLITDKRVYLLSLKCLEEVVNMSYKDENQETQFKIRQKLVLFSSEFLQQLSKIQPPTRSFETERTLKMGPNSSLAELNQYQMFCTSLCQIFSDFLRNNLQWMEQETNPDWLTPGQCIDTLKMALVYMVQLTEVKDDQLFRLTCDFWHWYSRYLVQFREDIYQTNGSLNQQVLVMTKSASKQVREKVHAESKIMNQCVLHLLLRVPTPEEVLITIDENGIPKKEAHKFAQSTQLYNTIREIFRDFAQVNWIFFKEILKYKLNKQFDGGEWSHENLNSLCWAVGALPGILPTAEEKSFLIYFLRNLLQMCDRKSKIASKAIIASNIMHIVSQYNRFLTVNFDFLKTVLNKLLEFMKNQFAGVQEMACNIFLKICSVCKADLARTVVNRKKMPAVEEQAYVIGFISEVESHTEGLDSFQRIQFYEAVGHMISAYPDEEGQINLLVQLMGRMEQVWHNMMKGLDNLGNFMNDNVLREICFYLRVNEKLAAVIGKPYSIYFNRSFGQIDKLYQGFYQLIQNEVAQNGPNALEFFTVKKFRAVRRDLLNLLKTFVKAFKNSQAEFITNYGELISFMLNCYSSETPELREPEVLLFMAESVNSLREQMEGVLSRVMTSVLEAVLPMITQDFSSFPEHRTNFFVFLQAMVNRCFQVFFAVKEDQFKTVINCVVWAIKHELPTIYEIGLSTLVCILECLSANPSFSEQFYKFYYLSILADTLFVLTDSLHSNGFTLQCRILFILLGQLNTLKCQVVPTSTCPDNKQAVFEYIGNVMLQNFGNLAENDHRKLLENIFNNVQDFKAFKTSFRDYLVSLNLYTLEQN